MKKAKLKDIIKKLDEIRQEYMKEFEKEPQIWGIDSFGDEIESVELCHSYRKSKNGIGHTASDIKAFYL